MVGSNRIKKLRLAGALCVLIALGAAAVALANLTVYSNSFSSKSQYSQIRKAGGGKSCDRSYRKASKKLRVIVRQGETLCMVRPPIEGDGSLPNHDVRFSGKFLKRQTPRGQRKGAYLALAVRSGDGARYQLIVKPRKKKYALTRQPSGSGFPKQGTLQKVKPLTKPNTLRLRAFGTRIRAFVNGKKVGSLTEHSPADISGKRILFGLGNTRPAQKSIAGVIDNLRVQVPNP